jgi:iron(III) transport system substrate-binding protein
MQPAIGIFSVIAPIKGGPHPNAGKLLVDFLISKEGQQLYADADYLPVDPEVQPRDPTLRPDGTSWRIKYLMPDEVEEKSAEWWKIYQDIFR